MFKSLKEANNFNDRQYHLLVEGKKELVLKNYTKLNYDDRLLALISIMNYVSGKFNEEELKETIIAELLKRIPEFMTCFNMIGVLYDFKDYHMEKTLKLGKRRLFGGYKFVISDEYYNYLKDVFKSSYEETKDKIQ